ncbi:hypothetical protein [Bacillus sp. B-jedd]|uniref:hypothetical protein n=1 Tax=Bacillus sp. B-jedd TaxID=1476857 RepID=UPI0005156B20|nr:hypothetical protein [Bacillus sp. B-jedd]CEG28113.1 hypothetical protein BN1002_02992 [Bacillus sp. B-jedd]
MGGAFQTSREIFNNPIWQDVIKFRLFFYIVGNAVFSDEGVKQGNILIKRGQFLRSYRNLAADLEYLDNKSLKKYSISVIKKKVDQLVKEERLEIEETELGTLFTVVNYAMYQGFEHYKKQNREQSENGSRTVREQSENNNNVNKDNKDLSNDDDVLEEPKQQSSFEQELIAKYMQLAAIPGFDIPEYQKTAVRQVVESGILPVDAMKYLEECFQEYKPKHSRDKINSFGYCATVILNKHAQAQAPQNPQARRGYGKKPIRQEHIPEWFDKKQEVEESPEVIEARKAEMEEMLKQFRR